jgi:hypothetical protein
MNAPVHTARTDWIGVAALSVAVSLFFGICIFVWQIYEFLRFDVWYSVSLMDVLRTAEVRWATVPTDWFGLYRILEWMPLSLLLPIIGVFWALVVGLQDDRI